MKLLMPISEMIYLVKTFLIKMLSSHDLSFHKNWILLLHNISDLSLGDLFRDMVGYTYSYKMRYLD